MNERLFVPLSRLVRQPSAGARPRLARIWRCEEFAAQKEKLMTNAILVTEANPSPSGLFSSKAIIKKSRASSTDAAKTVGREKASGRRAEGRMFDQSLLRGLLDPKASSLSLTALAQAAASSGKRLVLEIRDATPVKIIRTSTKGL
jgi:hypothetical protein